MSSFQCNDCVNKAACASAGKCIINSFSDRGVWETTDGGAYWQNVRDDFSIDTTSYINNEKATSGQT